jgi:hypothetical protein
MPALVAGIHVFLPSFVKDVDGRDISANARKTRFARLPGHDVVDRSVPASHWC